MQLESFYANKYSEFSCCKFPMDSRGNLIHIEKLDTVIVHRMMLLYSVCAFLKILHKYLLSFHWLCRRQYYSAYQTVVSKRGCLSFFWYLSYSDLAKFEGDIS